MDIQICQASYSVESYMVDFRDKLRFSMLLGLQQETAFQHAAQLFAHYGDPSIDGGFWVVTQSWTTLTRLPSVKEEINVHTWIRKLSRVISRRNFRVTDSQGHLIALTSMDWAVLDLATRRPWRLDTWNIGSEILVDEPGSSMEGQRLRLIPELAAVYPKTVRYTDIDVNRHANNTRYADWILDCFDLDYLGQKELSQIHLNFKQECAIGDRLIINKGSYNDDTYYVEGRFVSANTAPPVSDIPDAPAAPDAPAGLGSGERQAFQAKLTFI